MEMGWRSEWVWPARLEAFKKQNTEVVGVWMTDEEGVEEKKEERDVKEAAQNADTDFKLWTDEKYFIDE